ncbi:MAG TPA: hypothetical protein VGP79_03395 [Bryobacteraceae bacterium]|jgi:hypothetical protein|nr:hypothetical protein [Bryobacteraceae bacterium]
MELGQYQLQIFVSLVVILGAAFVALICDFLKGNNEQLRELTVELKVRREEEQRRGQVMTPRTAAARVAVAAENAARQTAAAAGAAESKSERKRPAFAQNGAVGQRRQASADALAAMERGARLAGAPRAASKPITSAPAARTNSQPPPLPTHAPQRATALLEAASPGITIMNAPAFSAPVPAAVIERPVVMEQVVIGQSVVIETPVIAQETPVIEQMIAQQPVVVTPEATSAPKKKDWGALLARRASASAPVAAEPALSCTAVEPTTTVYPLGDIPVGFHDGVVLTRLILARQPVTGLVVSIGVTANPKNGTVPEPVNSLIRSLIGADNFACSTGTDEFLLIYPRLNGAAAQRQLSLVAQQLWDFQLRSLGTTSILFSWGGVEVASESIDEAVASASERMNETRRNRKLVALPLRQAV